MGEGKRGNKAKNRGAGKEDDGEGKGREREGRGKQKVAEIRMDRESKID